MKNLRYFGPLLVLTVSLFCGAQNPTLSGTQLPQTTASSSGCSAAPADPRVVTLLARIKGTGEVQDVKAFSGPEALRPAAINAVRNRKYEFLKRSSHVWTIELAVTFAGDCDTVTDISQLVVVLLVHGGYPGKDRVTNIKQELMRGGGTGCVRTPPRIRISKEAMQAQLFSRVNPEYPSKARARRVEGVVVLKVTVDQQGNVIGAERVSGPKILVQAAINAVKEWKYRPFLYKGGAIQTEAPVEVKFEL